MANDEPSTAPEPDRWYDLTLGPSFKDQSKFCTLRYEFKPASIDKSQPGVLHKDGNKGVTVEYNNNQPGKPKLIFQGVSDEDYKENDAVLFFDGHSFRLERLHRAVKRLKHVRLPGEALAATPPSRQMSVQMMEHMITSGQTLASEQEEERSGNDFCLLPPNPSASSPPHRKKNGGGEIMDTMLDCGSEEDIDIVNGDDDNNNDSETSNKNNASGMRAHALLDIDINLPQQAETDDEIAEVDISDDDDDEGKGPNAAEALKAQVGVQDRKDDVDDDCQSSSSGTSSDSDSSGSERGSSSSSHTETTSEGKISPSE
ncbi:unnamed protein product [Linum trigynum]|uniref:Transcription elongation factor Eaf N-terminal domain-containing protein n=1 Tax=Linum trigynum TaxID=586398 RepID=A0AAV2GSE9_9ROSI